MKLTILIATAGRSGLERTLQSVSSQCYTNDELMVVGQTAEIEALARQYGGRFVQCARGNDWGHTERNFASPLATGDYLCHLDDDDCWAPGAREAIERAATEHPGKPFMFKMAMPGGGLLWHTPQLRYGNCGTPMIVVPNEPRKFGTWAKRYGGDYHFMQTMGWKADDIIWREDVIALIRPAVVCV